MKGSVPPMDSVLSVNGVPIRLPDERWQHIIENHDDLIDYYEEVLSTVELPELVLRGHKRTLIAARHYGRNRYLMVVYREVTGDDGFVVTAYFTGKLDRRKAIWRQS